MILNENGDVALVYLPPTDKKFFVGGREYHFLVRNGVSLCWVRKEDVEALLGYKKQCCGGSVTRPIRYANQSQVNHWNRRNL